VIALILRAVDSPFSSLTSPFSTFNFVFQFLGCARQVCIVGDGGERVFISISCRCMVVGYLTVFCEAPVPHVLNYHAKFDYSVFYSFPPGFTHSKQMGNCVSSQSQQAVVEKQAATGRGRSIVSLRKVCVICFYILTVYFQENNQKQNTQQLCASSLIEIVTNRQQNTWVERVR
jgi:hypothetical protein